MLIVAGNTMDEAKAAALNYSAKYRGVYVTLVADFGVAYLSTSKRLHVNAPGDCIGGCYWLNGVKKSFTESQVVQDQIHTPGMA